MIVDENVTGDLNKVKNARIHKLNFLSLTGKEIYLSFAQRDLVIYEMHVRGYTRHESSKTESPATYIGVVDKLDHLKVYLMKKPSFMSYLDRTCAF
ncbi:isoamylase 1 [Artemisia annua]|uniref:Isoamylase 1 n=1 Tax=Artemisia annua TaxID=35608 RepID=A0A2U1N488_ARTAN|nr:isoamylase 1 [Artemisia annua]